MFDVLKSRCILRLFARNCSVKVKGFPKQVFSAIQPSGEVHLGNYIGAVKRWVELQNTEKSTLFCIADLHSLSIPHEPKTLQNNILLMAATLLASGIDPSKTIFFRQSDVHQHAELYWILGTLATMARLSHLPQFKEKTELMKEVPVGIFMYPILQAADIALYKSTHVPVGYDQIQHIQLSNHLISSFNRRFGVTFPTTSIMTDKFGGSIKSLTNPDKKMSKSHHPNSKICVTDSPDEIRRKCKKALTDFISEITYEPEKRPGVSNLVLIHSKLTNKSTEDICKEFHNIDTGKYKEVLADIIIETLKPLSEEIQRLLASPDYLKNVLKSGAEKAAELAELTMKEVRSKIGINIESETLLTMSNRVQ